VVYPLIWSGFVDRHDPYQRRIGKLHVQRSANRRPSQNQTAWASGVLRIIFYDLRFFGKNSFLYLAGCDVSFLSLTNGMKSEGVCPARDGGSDSLREKR